MPAFSARAAARVAQKQRSLVFRHESHDAIRGGFVVEELLEAVVLLDALRGTCATGEETVSAVGSWEHRRRRRGERGGARKTRGQMGGYSKRGCRPARGDARGAPRTITDAGASWVARPSSFERFGARLVFFRAAATTRPRARPTRRETLARFPRDASRRETVSAEASRATGVGAAAVATRTPTTARIVETARSTSLVARARVRVTASTRPGEAKRTSEFRV